MKNLFLILLSSFIILAGCTQENVRPESNILTREQRVQAHVDLIRTQFAKSGKMSPNQTSGSRASCNKVPICHNGNYIVVNKNAVPGHLAHGDQLTCCGNSCINDVTVLQNGGPFTFYYDTDVNDCLGFIGDGFGESIILAWDGDANGIVVESYTYNNVTEYYSYEYTNYAFTCFNGNLTIAQYECARDYLKSFLKVNACIPNFCDLEF